MQEPIAGASESDALPGFGPTGQCLLGISKLASLTGGLIFMGLVVMSIVSITGRKLFSMPVPGDVEMLQVCSAFAASTFFAYCHLHGGDVKVDFFTTSARPSTVHLLDALGSTLFGLVGALIAWRTTLGVLTVKEAGETTMILGWPLWIGQMLMVPGFVLMALAGFYMAGLHLIERSRLAGEKA